MLQNKHYKETKTEKYTIALLPWGATEPHNYHLPYGTDTFQSVAIAEKASALANTEGAGCVVLPALPYGVNGPQLSLPMTMNINPSTQLCILRDIINSLKTHGVTKLLIINGHGGNDFKPIVRELQLEIPEVTVGVIDWWKIPTDKKYFTEAGDHAGELETALMMYLLPELVLPLEQAGEGKEYKPTVYGFREGWVWTPRPWHKISADSGVGNPKDATAEKGEQYFAEITQKIARAVLAFARADKEKFYEPM